MELPSSRICAELLISCFCILQAAAEENLVTILLPADGAKLAASQPYTLEFEVKPAAKAEHVHLLVDGEETAVSHKLKGSFTLGPLNPGDRKICISPVNKNHTAIAGQTCINVTVQ
jgi:hypothetical protein